VLTQDIGVALPLGRKSPISRHADKVKVGSFFAQVTGGASDSRRARCSLHYDIHPITDINTSIGALFVAFSFWPGMIVGYFAMWVWKHWAKDEEPEPPAAAALYAVLWFIYLFRALTLFIGLPVLSNLTQVPVDWLVKIFESFG